MALSKHSLSRSSSRSTKQPFRLRTAGRIRNDPYHSTRGTYHADAMLTLFAAGRGRYHHAGEVTQIQAGMVGLVLPQEDTGLLMADPAEPYDHYYCRFSGQAAMDTARRIHQQYDKQAFFPCSHWQELVPIWEQVILRTRVRIRNKTDDFLPADGLIATLLAQLEHPSLLEERTYLEANTLLAYMHDRISHPMDIETMAEHFHLSKSHLCRKAHVLLGKTLVTAWREIKMDWARQLLQDPELYVRDIARRVGYEDPYYFSNVFREQHGMSPRSWRLVHASSAS